MISQVFSAFKNYVFVELLASPAAQPNLPRQRRRASCRLVNAIIFHS
jgi:hypothetical protein